MAMRRVIKEKWLNALRSGEYDQHEGSLCNATGDAFCCLGVLKNITGQLAKKNWGDSSPAYAKDDEWQENPLPYAGLSPAQQEKLMEMNDSGESFKTIASYISKNVKVVD